MSPASAKRVILRLFVAVTCVVLVNGAPDQVHGRGGRHHVRRCGDGSTSSIPLGGLPTWVTNLFGKRQSGGGSSSGCGLDSPSPEGQNIRTYRNTNPSGQGIIPFNAEDLTSDTSKPGKTINIYPMEGSFMSESSGNNDESPQNPRKYQNVQQQTNPGGFAAVRKPKPQNQNLTGTDYEAGGSDAQRWLAAHNSVRAQYSAPNLVWSQALVATAKQKTDSCTWGHTSGDQYGENIAAGQDSLETVTDEWVNGQNEKDTWDPSYPLFSHFTQVVWVGSQELGCSLTTCNGMQGLSFPQSEVTFWACEYNPPGNVIGEFGSNVKASKGGSPA